MDIMEVKRFLFKHKLYQYQLAAKLSVSEAFLSKVLRGRLKANREFCNRLKVALKYMGTEQGT